MRCNRLIAWIAACIKTKEGGKYEIKGESASALANECEV
jgi:hypothetical protein